MAAEVISAAGHPVTLYEKKSGPGKKLLIAGSSGLNVSNSLPLDEFIARYTGPSELWLELLNEYPPKAWLSFIESLGLETFEGTSRRYFVREMKASKLLRAWLDRLKARGVLLRLGEECTDFDSRAGHPLLSFANGTQEPFAAVCLCLGGGSYEPQEKPLRWPKIFLSKGLAFREFTPSNVGYQVAWSESFLKEAEGKPFKNILLTSSRGSRKGEAVVTRYGIEGTPVISWANPGSSG
jgi:predicted flavoprotein YhiN